MERERHDSDDHPSEALIFIVDEKGSLRVFLVFTGKMKIWKRRVKRRTESLKDRIEQRNESMTFFIITLKYIIKMNFLAIKSYIRINK